MSITNQHAKTAVARFLARQIELKTEKLQKQLAKAQSEYKQAEVAKLQAEIDEICQKYDQKIWLDNACNHMAKQLKFGTHISKGIHPDAKGDNVSFIPKVQYDTLVGTHSLSTPALDANGNAAALPLASFFDFDVIDGVKVRDLIVHDDVDFIGSLSSDPAVAKAYHATFKQVLQGSLENPSTHERNKQLLWSINSPTANHLEALAYVNIIPLYPSALTYAVYQKIHELRYSDDNKKALENRFKANAKHCPYVTLPNLAVVQLGGSKPQNISQLMSRQGGRNYLLPSLPPKISPHQTAALSKFSENFFDSKVLAYKTQRDFEFIAEVIDHARNRVDVRNQRKDAIDRILHTIFSMAHQLQSQPAGWSKDYALPLAQKIWLDPHRATLAGEEDFARHKAEDDWQGQIIDDFARWLNHTLKQRFDKIRHQFADSEFYEWQKEIETMIDAYKRQGKGVFL